MTITNDMLRIVITTSLLATIIFTDNAFSADPIFVNAKVVEFDSVSYAYTPSPFKVKQAKKQGKTLEIKIEPSVSITGYLSKPAGEEPRAAIVLLHACAGILASEEMWSNRLVSWGYVVLAVDSFAPRGYGNLCNDDKVTQFARVLDAYGAKQYLETRSFVDPNRIAVMGRSHGALTVLETIKKSIPKELSVKPFQAAIAIYPHCLTPVPINTPTLILSGEKDQWNPAELCAQYVDGLQSQHDITFKVFAGAYHAFDEPGVDGIEGGYIIRYNPEAAARTNELSREFLEQRL